MKLNDALTGLLIASTSRPVIFREAFVATVRGVLENSAITVFRPGTWQYGEWEWDGGEVTYQHWIYLGAVRLQKTCLMRVNL